MSQPILVLDTHYLCHRAFHTTQDLSWKQRPTGVVFGFLKSISFLKDEFQTDRVVFCFEHNHLFRRDVFPDYKKRRITKERTTEEKAALTAFAIQISELRQRYLPTIGFKNVFRYNGMESDDIMASIAAHYGQDNEVILVTADLDLLQCITPNVSVYSPQKRLMMTEHWFRKTYKIRPSKWAVVKAIAGCKGDGVPGIRGVGEISALRFVQEDLPAESKAFGLITSEEGRKVVLRNRQLVQLPYVGCPIPKLQEDRITKEAWLSVVGSLGMRSLADRPPISTKRLLSRTDYA